MSTQADIAMFGLGTMGRNLLLNIADRGFTVAGYNRTASKLDALLAEAGDRHVVGARSVEELMGQLKRPRVVMTMVPAGAAVDSVLDQLQPFLESDDIVIDGGNSHFSDTERRVKELGGKGVQLLGMGVSGGEHGARYGPSLMPGGPQKAYQQVRHIFEAAAAKVNGDPCITYLGPRSAGHYVKMVHNGIEYGIMQLLAESYDLMKRGLGLTNDELHGVYASWNQEELNAFLVEITAAIFSRRDDRSNQRLIDRILDQAKQKGTGKWTSQNAHDLGIPTPTIDVAVSMRYLSARREERQAASQVLAPPQAHFQGDRETAIAHLRSALYAAMVITYAQGLDLIQEASAEYGYDSNLEGVVRIWRGGCIIRAAMLTNFRQAYLSNPSLPNLLLDPALSQAVMTCEPAMRFIVEQASRLTVPVPAFMASLAYLDSYRSERLPANLIQAQRDYFGAHGYQRTDSEGTFHTEW